MVKKTELERLSVIETQLDNIKSLLEEHTKKITEQLKEYVTKYEMNEEMHKLEKELAKIRLSVLTRKNNVDLKFSEFQNSIKPILEDLQDRKSDRKKMDNQIKALIIGMIFSILTSIITVFLKLNN